MGAWGVGSFDNDDALDWVAELLESDGSTVFLETFGPLTEDPTGYHEAPECSMALAAAEVVAALNGRPAADLPDDVIGWVGERLGSASANLVSSARQAVAAVSTGSELKELWEESDQHPAWQERVADLSRRLA